MFEIMSVLPVVAYVFCDNKLVNSESTAEMCNITSVMSHRSSQLGTQISQFIITLMPLTNNNINVIYNKNETHWLRRRG